MESGTHDPLTTIIDPDALLKPGHETSAISQTQEQCRSQKENPKMKIKTQN